MFRKQGSTTEWVTNDVQRVGATAAAVQMLLEVVLLVGVVHRVREDELVDFVVGVDVHPQAAQLVEYHLLDLDVVEAGHAGFV